jgi:CheY-like chemotaxis protein
VHDFGNILTGISGCAGLIRVAVEPESDVDRHAARIESAVRQATDISQQLLTFARKGDVSRAEVNIDDTIADIVSVFSHALDTRIKVETMLGASGATVRGNPGQLRQVFLNLAVNARDSMAEGGTITIETQICCPDDGGGTSARLPGGYVSVVVRDTGHGIPADIQDRIFEPLFTTRGAGQGTGLGLATAYAVVQSHGGALELEESSDAGTTFRVLLPLSHEGSGDVDARAEDERIVCARVLVSMRETVLRIIIEQMLERLGCVVVRPPADEKLEEFYAVHASDVDVVLLDVAPREAAAVDRLRTIRAADPHARVVATCGEGASSVSRELLNAGAVGFLPRPFTAHQLGESIRQALACAIGG